MTRTRQGRTRCSYRSVLTAAALLGWGTLLVTVSVAAEGEAGRPAATAPSSPADRPARNVGTDEVEGRSPAPARRPSQLQQARPTDDEASGSRGAGEQALIFDSPTSRISFQAYLTDDGGVALPGPTVDLEFRIYDGGGGLVEGPISLNAVSIANGIVDVQVPVSPSSFDGTERQLGVTVDPPGDELSPHIALVSVPYAFRVNRVASEELDDDIELGDPDAYGRLRLFDMFYGVQAIELSAFTHDIVTYGFDGVQRAELGGVSWGVLLLQDSIGNDLTAKLNATSNSGGELTLYDADGGLSVFAEGDAAGGSLTLYDTTHSDALHLSGDEGDGGALLTLNDGSVETIRRDGSGGGGGAGVTLSNNAGTSTIVLDADSSDDGMVRLYDADGNRTIELHSDSSQSASQISLLAPDTGSTLRETVEIIASEGSEGGLSNNGGQIILRKADGTDSITLDAEHGVGGSGRIITPVIQITGGSDLSESFDISGTFRPGYVVCIDARNPGKLVVSANAYDRTVAGVISGAKGIHPGMLMGQRGSEADGKLPVALTGRVYVWADASAGPIQPGDLLTSSDTPGHAMKVVDYHKAHGAVIGKAMTSLGMGRGLVLALVSLQ